MHIESLLVTLQIAVLCALFLSIVLGWFFFYGQLESQKQRPIELTNAGPSSASSEQEPAVNKIPVATNAIPSQIYPTQTQHTEFDSLRIQAFERLTLLLERMRPHQLVLRLKDQSPQGKEFHRIMLHEIRSEYNHNMSQQIYVTGDTWTFIAKSVEHLIGLINTAAAELKDETDSNTLAKIIFQIADSRQEDAISLAIEKLKEEIKVYLK